MLRGAGLHCNGPGFLHGLLVLGQQPDLLALDAHIDREAVSHAVKKLLLVGIGAVGAADIDVEAVVPQVLQHLLQMGKRRGVEHHVVLGALDLAHIRRITGGEQMGGIGIDEGVLREGDINIRPDILGRFRCGRGIERGIVHAVAADDAALHAADDHFGLILRPGAHHRVEHQAENGHQQDPAHSFTVQEESTS